MALAFAVPLLSVHLLPGETVAGGEHDHRVRVAYSLRSSTVSRYEPVIAEVLVRNEGTRAIVADFGAAQEENLRVTVTSPRGQTTPPLAWRHEWGFVTLGGVSVPAGEERVETMLLNEWYGFADVGTYRIDLDLVGAFPVGVVALTRGRVDLEVTPRNETRLREACRRLSEEMDDESSTPWPCPSCVRYWTVRSGTTTFSFVDWRGAAATNLGACWKPLCVKAASAPASREARWAEGWPTSPRNP